MIIKEDAIIKIVDKNDIERAVVDKIVSQEDITIDGDGRGYTFLLRNRACEENCIFEADKIYNSNGEYIVEGYFKDAILVISDKWGNEMHDSYMGYDN